MNLGKFKVHFSHLKRETTRKREDGTKVVIINEDVPAKFKVITGCELIPLGSEEVLATGNARCHIRDNFSYNEGRKRALKRALTSSDISKEDRTEIWEDYRLSATTPRWGEPVAVTELTAMS